MAEDSVPVEIRRLGFSMCKHFVGGIWSQIAAEKFQIETLSGGLSNYLFICSLLPGVKVPGKQPKKVVLRKYGEIATHETVLQETVVAVVLSEKQLGPKLYGMTLEARIEEYIQAGPLSTTDLHNPTLSRMIARKLAMLHALEMPACKEPKFIDETMDKWQRKVSVILNKTHSDHDRHYMNTFRDYKLEEELQILKKILSEVESPVVFSHNDLQEGNILYNENIKDIRKRMTFVDWEFSGYNYSVTKYPFFTYTEHHYPTKEQQYEFFKAYLLASDGDPDDSILDGMYQEANSFALASHFLWGLWAILQHDTSNIPFGFLEYADNRFKEYFRMKQLKDKSQIPDC